jgi:hypothetical protein
MNDKNAQISTLTLVNPHLNIQRKLTGCFPDYQNKSSIPNFFSRLITAPRV